MPFCPGQSGRVCRWRLFLLLACVSLGLAGGFFHPLRADSALEANQATTPSAAEKAGKPAEAAASDKAVWQKSAPQFFLITIGPGSEYWSAWGHTELLVRQPGREDLIYSYGYFDFSDEDFFTNFLKGRMRYFLDHELAARELNRFAAENRDIWAQALNIPPDKAITLLRTLQGQDTDASRYYDYDYFLANCTSQVRDLINESVKQPFKPDWQNRPDQSWAESTLPVANQGWLNLALNLGYGREAWRPRTAWEGAVFPLRLMRGLQDFSAGNALAEAPRLLYQGQQKPARFLSTHGPLVFVSVFFLLALGWGKSRQMAIKAWLLLQSLVGVALLSLWLLTEHRIAAENFNILLMWPLAVLLLRCAGRWCAVALFLYVAATLAWLVWALWAGAALYLLPLAGLNLLVAFLLFRSGIFR